jgi:glycosyltransferase involved in cell wall biosynthesis
MVSKFIEFPLVSIVTVVYNGENTLERTIISVINQTYKNIEYIIIDGGSIDNTLSIVNKYKHHISTIISEKDKGIYDAMNKGISLANGSLVGIINSDDWYEIDAVEKIVSSFLSNTNFDVYYGVLRFLALDGNTSAIQGISHENLKNSMISHPTCFVQLNTYRKHGIFNTNYRIAADYEFILRIYLKGCNFYFIEEILANFSHGGVSTVNNYDLKSEILSIKLYHSLISTSNYFLHKIYLFFRYKIFYGL